MQIVVNEVYYDPSGADGGYEFVELVAAAGTSGPVSLAGWRLETGNGAAPGDWRLAWEGGFADSLGAEPFVLGESGVEPRPQVVVDLDLQNGPDACRWVAPDGSTDVVGWGEDLDPALFEGTPAPDVPSGRSLARLPDGLDTQDNARDFAASDPSPGSFNAPEHAWTLVTAVWPPEELAPGEPWRFQWRVRNTGRAAWAEPLRVECHVHPGEVLITVPVGTPLPPGAERALEAFASPPPGVHWPRCDPAAESAPHPWWGSGAELRLNEVLAAPSEGGAEWVEIQAAGARRVDLSRFELEDAAGSHTSLAGSLDPGEFLVVTPDTAAVRARWSQAGSALVQLSPWPVLNQTAAAGQVAERITLRLQERRVSEAVVPGGGTTGVSWERVSASLDGGQVATWERSLDPRGGTPGRVNSHAGDRVLAVGGGIRVSPEPFHPDRGQALLIAVDTRGRGTRCAVNVWDSAGRKVTDLRPWEAGAEHRALWDGRTDQGAAVPLGLYVIRADDGAGAVRRKTLVVVR